MSNLQLEEFFSKRKFDYSKWEKTLTDKGIESIDENQLIEYIYKSNEVRRLNYIYRDVETTLIKL